MKSQSSEHMKICHEMPYPPKAQRRGFAFIACALLAVLVLAPRTFPGQIVLNLTMDEMVKRSDFIFKAKTIYTTPVKDEWFPGDNAHSTRMQVISVIKGSLGSQLIDFHHYRIKRNTILGGSTSILDRRAYEFEPGRCYIIFAAETTQDGIFRQIWKDATEKPDQGAYLAADDAAVRENNITDILFGEFTRMLNSSRSEDVLYAICQLDEMSNPLSRQVRLKDFNRAEVLRAISPFILSRDEELAKAAIKAVGGSNPYFNDSDAIFWLVKVGGHTLQNIAPWEGDQNPGAHRYFQELEQVADGTGSMELRSTAIRALGRAEQPDLLPAVLRWAYSTEALIREAATVLLADFPVESVKDAVFSSANDPDSGVRRAAARAIGFAQFTDLLPVLNRALLDPNNKVRGVAALSLASFSPKQSGDILLAHIDDPDYKVGFANILASEHTAPYLDMLCEIIQQREYSAWGGTAWSGELSYFDSWDILFRYLKTQTAKALQSGQFDRQLEALESAPIQSSSEPRDLYELYLSNGLKARAAKYREYVSRTSPFDMEIFLRGVDEKYGGSK